MDITSIITFIATYLIIWWIVIFAILPIGIESEKKVEQGHDSGAPENPKLKKKIITTSIIALILTGIIYYYVDSEMLNKIFQIEFFNI